MAGLDTAVSSGANLDSDLRRRNVPASKANVDLTRTIDEEKSKSKQVRELFASTIRMGSADLRITVPPHFSMYSPAGNRSFSPLF